jgi:small subunit ribosomal protein S17
MSEQIQEDAPKAARNVRASRIGLVVSAKGDKTLVVRVTRRVRHPLYDRFIKKSTKLHVHDEENSAGEGDTVRVVSTRPLSKLKRWRLDEIIERAK